jgi:alpha-L-fucosidase 2
MIHVWDHFDHTNDVGWWKAQGWPLLKVILKIVSFPRRKPTTCMHIGSSELPSRQAYARPSLQ